MPCMDPMVDAYDLLATRFHSVRAVRACVATGTLSIPGPEEDSDGAWNTNETTKEVHHSRPVV